MVVVVVVVVRCRNRPLRIARPRRSRGWCVDPTDENEEEEEEEKEEKEEEHHGGGITPSSFPCDAKRRSRPGRSGFK